MLKIETIKKTMCLAIVGAFCLTANGKAAIPDSLKQRIDSLKEVSRVSSGMKKYEADFKIAWDLFDLDNEIAAAHAKLAYQFATTESDTSKIVVSGRLYGQLIRRLGMLEEATEIFEQLLPVAERTRNSKETVRLANALAVAYTFQGKFDRGLIFDLKVLRLRLAAGETARVGEAYGNIGFIYYTMGDLVEASSYFEKAIQMGDSLTKSQSLLNLGLAKVFMNDLHAFPSLAKQAIVLSPVEALTQNLTQFNIGFGWYHLKLGSLDSAEFHFRRALNSAIEVSDARTTYEVKMFLAECAEKRRDFDASIQLLKEVEEGVSRARFASVRIKCYNRLSSTCAGKGLWEEALFYKSRQLTLQDSLYDQRIQTRIAAARAEFEERENEEKIARQAEMLTAHKAEITRQKWLMALTLALALVSGVLVVMFQRFNALQRKISKQRMKSLTYKGLILDE